MMVLSVGHVLVTATLLFSGKRIKFLRAIQRHKKFYYYLYNLAHTYKIFLKLSFTSVNNILLFLFKSELKFSFNSVLIFQYQSIEIFDSVQSEFH